MTTVPIPAAVQELMRELMPQTRMPRYRYFENKATGEMFCWTVETMSNGKYVCWNYQPYGEGSRSGKPRAWKPVDRVEFAKRKTAKARALARYQKSIATERK